MRRREFVQLLGGAALWSSGAVAQTNDKKRIVGLMSGFSEAEMRPLVEASRTRMQELGWIDGQNITVVVRTTSGNYKRLETEADSLAAAPADVIVALGTPSLLAARRNSKTTPVVFTQVADPVGQKFIDSLARPGGNITGLTNFEFAFGGKWLELLTGARSDDVACYSDNESCQRKHGAVRDGHHRSRRHHEGCHSKRSGSQCYRD